MVNAAEAGKQLCWKQTFSLLFISLFATVSTGWNPRSSKIPLVPEPASRAATESLDFPLDGGGDMSFIFRPKPKMERTEIVLTVFEKNR